MTSAAFSLFSSLDRVVSAIESRGLRVERRKPHDVMTQCPAHADGRPSLHVTWSDGQTMLHCFAGCTPKIGGKADPSAVLDAIGLQATDLFDEPMKRDGSDAWRSTVVRARPARPKAPPKKTKPKVDLGKVTGRWRLVAEWLYPAADGSPCGKVVRRERPRELGVERSFKQFRWAPDEPLHDLADGTGWVLERPDPPVLYQAPQVVAAVAAGDPVYVAEGEKDADALHSAGAVATTNAGGAGTWHEAYTSLLTGADVRAVVDRDVAGYQRGLNLRFKWLADAAASVRVLIGRIEAAKADAYDHVTAGHGLDELIEVEAGWLLEQLVEAEADDGAHKAAVWLADYLASGGDLAALLPDAQAAGLVVRLAQECPEHGDVLFKAIGLGWVGPAVPSPTPAAAQPATSAAPKVKPRYEVVGGDICEWVSNRNGGHWQVLVGCCPRVARVEVEDLGADGSDLNELKPTRAYVVSWERLNPTTGELIVAGEQRVEADKWNKGGWLDHCPWPDVVLPRTTGERQKAADGIRMATGGVATRTPVFVSTGWRLTDAGWTYVHAGGAITAAGDLQVQTRLSGPAARMRFGPSTPDSHAWALGFAAIKEMSEELPIRIGAPIVGIVARAALTALGATVDFSGNMRSGKSSTAVLAASVFDTALTYRESHVSLADTGPTLNAIIRELHSAADALVLGDDASTDSGVRVSARKVAQLKRHIWNGVDRRRAARDGQETFSGGAPRATLILAGEVRAGEVSASAQTRGLDISLAPGDVAIHTVLPALHRKARKVARNTALHGLIAWMAGRRDDLLTDLDRFTGRDEDNSYASAFDAAGLPTRVSDVLAQLAFGIRLWIQCALTHGTMTSEQAEAWWAQCWHGLLEAGHRSAEISERAGYDERIRRLIESALRSGRAHLRPRSAEVAYDYRLLMACGHKPEPRAPRDPAMPDGVTVVPSGQHIGWVDRDRVYLLPEMTLQTANELATRAGESLDISPLVAGEALAGAGRLEVHLTKSGKRRFTVRKTCDGRLAGGLWSLSRDWLLNDGDEDDDDQAGPPGGTTVPPTPGPDPEPVTAHRIPDARHTLEVEHTEQADDDDAPTPAETLVNRNSPPAAPGGGTEPTADSLCCAEIGCGQRIDGEPVWCSDGQPRHPQPCAAFYAIEQDTVVTAVEEVGECQYCGQECITVWNGRILHALCAYRWFVVVWQRRQHETPAPATPSTVDTPASPPARQPASTPVQKPRDTPSTAEPKAGLRALCAVAHTDGIHLPDGTVVPLPEQLEHLGDLAQTAIDLRLGWRYDADWQPERGQIWITAELATKLGLPDKLPPESNKDAWRKLKHRMTKHGWLSKAHEAGWNTGGETLRAWTSVWKTGGGGALVVVPHWLSRQSLKRFDFDEQGHQVDPATLAKRIQLFADTAGLPLRYAANHTGVRLMQWSNRGKTAPKLAAAVGRAEPARHHYIQADLNWSRPFTDTERGLLYLHEYDMNACYCNGANSLYLGLDVPPTHHVGAAAATAATVKNSHGYFRIFVEGEIPAWIPNPADPTGRGRLDDGSYWVLLPTLAFLTELKIAFRVVEAYAWPANVCRRLLDSWVGHVRTVVYAAKTQAAQGDLDMLALLPAFKGLYTGGIGQLAHHEAELAPDEDRDDPWWRPDIRHAILARSQANVLRPVCKAGEATGHWPVAIRTDAICYATNEPDPKVFAEALGLQLCPQEMQFGKWKHKKSGLLVPDTIEAFDSGTGWSDALDTSMFVPAEWSLQLAAMAVR